MFDETSTETSRAIVLVSDGAAVIDRRVQDALRAAAARDPVRLYWLFLRTAGARGITDKPPPGEADSPQTYPERHLDIFFKTLGLPYRSFEARSAAEVSDAIREIDQLEQRPTLYSETIPRQDLDWLCYWAAAGALLLLLGAKLSERRLEDWDGEAVRTAPFFTSPRRGEVARRSRAGEGEMRFSARSRSPHPALRADLSPLGRGEAQCHETGRATS